VRAVRQRSGNRDIGGEGEIAMNVAVILALALVISGVALTAAFLFGLIPLGSIY
jgi:hypothetical protein